MLLASIAYAGGSSSVGGVYLAPITTAQPNNQFGYELMRATGLFELKENSKKNVFISPISAAMALQMLLNGAGTGSTTYSELAKAMNIGMLDLDTVNQSNKRLLAELQDSGEIGSRGEVPFKLSIANSAWSSLSSPFTFSSSFVSTLEQFFQAEAKRVDFSSQAGADAINLWAEQKTAGKVPKVIDAQTLASQWFILMNATYFKANWSQPFNKDVTIKNQNFKLSDGTKVLVDMMSDRAYGYVETSNAQVMELPYSGGKASMYVVLPKEDISIHDALSDREGPLSPQFWDKLAQAEHQMADFSMPKFSFSYSIKLNDILQSIGVRDLFTGGADLSRAGTPATTVSLIKQDTFIKVDEDGTEAAAVTIIGGVGSGMPPHHIPVMKVDRPFLVSIVEKTTGIVLFLGVISSPEIK